MGKVNKRPQVIRDLIDASTYIRPLAKVIAGVLWGLKLSDRSPVLCER
jgi:hypothetical protein